MAWLSILAAMRTYSPRAMEVQLDLPSLDVFIREEAAQTDQRLRAVGYQTGSGTKGHQYNPRSKDGMGPDLLDDIRCTSTYIAIT